MRTDDRVVAITCIGLCNKKPKKWWDGEMEVEIGVGQFVRSRDNLAKACNMPLQRVRTSVQHLENTGFLTRLTTKYYTLYTLPKYTHYQDLAKYSDSVMSKDNPESNPPLTRDQPAANHQQQQNKRNRRKLAKSVAPEGTGDGSVVVVRRQPADPILDKISFRISMHLLDSVKMAQVVASKFAVSKTVGQVLRVVQQARLQRKPGGWAKMALDGDWRLPEPAGDELAEIIQMIKADVDQTTAYTMTRMSSNGFAKRHPGEDEETWFRRVNDELRRRKESAKSGESEKRGRPDPDHQRASQKSSG